ncbi:MAG TPA: hypothetical protein VGB13_07915 [Candidatus Krumholzibacteria bacterium]
MTTNLDTAAIRAEIELNVYMGRSGIVRGLVRQLCDALDEARAENERKDKEIEALRVCIERLKRGNS